MQGFRGVRISIYIFLFTNVFLCWATNASDLKSKQISPDVAERVFFARYQAREPGTDEELVECYGHIIRTYLDKKMGHRSEKDDLFQEVLLQFHLNRENMDLTNPAGLLRTITKRRYADWVKAQRNVPEQLSDIPRSGGRLKRDPPPSWMIEYQGKILAQDYALAVALLKDNERKVHNSVAVLEHFEGDWGAEIGKRTGESPGQVRTLNFYAVGKLESRLKDAGYASEEQWRWVLRHASYALAEALLHAEFQVSVYAESVQIVLNEELNAAQKQLLADWLGVTQRPLATQREYLDFEETQLFDEAVNRLQQVRSPSFTDGRTVTLDDLKLSGRLKPPVEPVVKRWRRKGA